MNPQLKSKEEVLSDVSGYDFDFIKDKIGSQDSYLDFGTALSAMQIYSDQNCERTQDLFTAPNEVLKPLEALYMKERPCPQRKYYVPDRTEFYTWIVEKIINPTSGR